uniref:WD repeat-containing protein 76 n=1 Tax=Callorhinchus milii TaxID=7868 RepID=A0A4W3JYE8_CALMI
MMHLLVLQTKMKGVESVPSAKLREYKLKLNRMTIRLDQVAKMTTSRLCSIAIHPSVDKLLIAAGSRRGQIGLWDLNSPPDNDAVRLFKPHINPINCLCFNPYKSEELLSLSNNESILCGNLPKGIFHEVYKVNYLSMSSFDFLNDDGATLIVSHWSEYVSLVDRRTPGTGPELVANLNMERFRMVNVHPMQRQYFVATGARAVNIYDIRYLKEKSKRVACLENHHKNINSAYFSPVTGRRVLTTCSDGMIRLFDIKGMTSTIPLKTIRRNHFTDRTQTKFRAVWDPQQDDFFIAGSTVWPRQIEVFHSSGAMVHAFRDPDCLSSICLINVMHPTRNILFFS